MPLAYCELHHLRWWDRDGGLTNLANCAAYCSFHHHEIHRRDIQVTRRPDGSFEHRHPDGRHYGGVAPGSEVTPTAEARGTAMPAAGPSGGAPSPIASHGGVTPTVGSGGRAMPAIESDGRTVSGAEGALATGPVRTRRADEEPPGDLLALLTG